jgi:hypothetical protein
MSDKRPILTYEAQINRVLPGLIPEIREQVLADAEARIEGLVHKEQGFDNADMEYGYGRGLAESIRALAALTQPQSEEPSPYAKAFRERFPVPEFPGIEKEES